MEAHNEQDQPTRFQKAKPYRIMNCRNSNYLTVGQQIKTNALSMSNSKQLFLIQQSKEGLYSIISLPNGQSLTKSITGTVELQKFKNRQNQLFQIQFAFHDKKKNLSFFWISSSNNNEQILFVTQNTSNIKFLTFDRTLFGSLWAFSLVDQYDKNFGFSQIQTSSSQLAIQVQDGSIEQGAYLVQLKKHGKGSQRWIIQKLFNNYVIRNLSSGMVITIDNQPLKQVGMGFNLLPLLSNNVKCQRLKQQIFKNSKDQKWNISKFQNNYYLQSVESQLLFIGVLSSKEKDFIYLIDESLFGEDKKNIKWTIQGALPSGIPLAPPFLL